MWPAGQGEDPAPLLSSGEATAGAQAPQYTRQMVILERVQSRATKKGLEHLSCAERLGELRGVSLGKGYRSYRKEGNKRMDPGYSQLCPVSGSEGMGTHTGTQESPSKDQEALFLYEVVQERGHVLGNQLWIVLLVHGGLVIYYLKRSFPNSTIL